MQIPLDTRPIITSSDIIRGAITRFFAQSVSTRKIYEIDKEQYNTFSKDPYYTVEQIPWIIRGKLYTEVVNNTTILSVSEQNERIVKFYERSIPGLSRKLKNFLEYTSPTVNTPSVPPITAVQYNISEASASAETTATAITLAPTSLTFSYQIGSTVPNSQSVSITADGSLSGLSISSGSSWVSASLMDVSAPTTVWIYPITTGLYSGSYSSTVTVSSTQTGITSKQVAVTLNITNSPDVLFIYAPGMSFGSSSFSRSSIATYNEVV